MKKSWLPAWFFGAVLVFPGFAFAQNVPPNISTQVRINPIPPTPPGTESEFVGPLAHVGQTLAAYGVHLNVNYSDTFANAGTQGLTHWAEANLGKLRFEGSFDLDKIGLPGGSIIAAETIHMFRKNTYQFLNLVGDSPGNAVIGNHKPANSLSVLAYEQKFFNDRLEIELGHYNPSYDFDPSICGAGPVCALNIAKFTGGFLPVDYGQLGAVARVKLPEGFLVKLGVFESVPPPGFNNNGFSFLLGESDGVLSLAQVGHTTSRTAEYPGTYLFTVFQNDQKFTNLATKAERYGTVAIMGHALQTVWRSDSAKVPAHHLDLFAKAAATPDSYQPYSAELETGANFYGLFPGRPFDRVGVKLSYFRVTASALAGQEAARVALHGLHEETSPNEFRFELLGTYDIYRHVTLTPDIMYILNPDDMSGHEAKLPTNGLEFTLTLHMPLGAMLGLAPQQNL